MNAKVTVQDIADALHLSRTTVSKVLNGSASVSEETRNRVLQKAAELNYKNYGAILAASNPSPVKRVAFLMHMKPDSLHIGSVIMTQIEQEIRLQGYSLTIYTITDKDIEDLTLPPNLTLDQFEGMVCLEVFHPEYSRFLCSLSVPVIFIDACADFYGQKLGYDLLMMENRHAVYQMLTVLQKEHQFHTMGFIGDFRHCLSFRERYEGFLWAAFDSAVRTEGFSVTEEDSNFVQPGWLRSQLRQLKQLPELFFCANDAIAISVIHELTALGYSVPGNLLVCGFDDISAMEPTLSRLTTVHAPSSALGAEAANLLFARIKNPQAPARAIYLRTDVRYRETAPV